MCVFSCWWSCELEGGGGVRGRGERSETGEGCPLLFAFNGRPLHRVIFKFQEIATY